MTIHETRNVAYESCITKQRYRLKNSLKAYFDFMKVLPFGKGSLEIQTPFFIKIYGVQLCFLSKFMEYISVFLWNFL